MDKTKSNPLSQFPNYMQVKPIIPTWVWHCCRVITVTTVIALCVFLFIKPDYALFAFWAIFAPIAPFLFFIAPGFWRNICPMAAVNQISREWNITRKLSLPKELREYSYLISLAIIFSLT